MLASPTAPTHQPQMAATAAPMQQERAAAIVPLGYVLGFLFPIVGLVLGIVAWTRPAHATKKHGPWIILVSVLSFIGALLILSAMGGAASS
jgi:pheromone shutdown protein TraB